MPITFDLQFDRKEIPIYAARYDSAGDNKAMDAGQRIANGDYAKANVEAIFKWKTNGRGISRLLRNSQEDISDALKLAIEAKTDRAAVAVLVGLQGVDVPVASAILTVVNQEKFTVIDFRALAALGARIPSPTVNSYLEYLNACRAIADENNVSLRSLDRALWQWHKDTHGQ